MNTTDNFPNLYSITGNILDINQMLVNRDELSCILKETTQAQHRLTKEQRNAVFENAEYRMSLDPNLAWRNAIVDATEASHGIGEKS